MGMIQILTVNIYYPIFEKCGKHISHVFSHSSFTRSHNVAVNIIALFAMKQLHQRKKNPQTR